jgi:glycosyltransferase involved in cell wall biosynthesis
MNSTVGTKIRVIRVIARMNIGGAGLHVHALTTGLSSARYDQVLVIGALGPREGSLEGLVTDAGAEMHRLPRLRPEVRPWDDLRALVGLIRLIRRHKPDIVETHTAKAGVIGRLAAMLARRPRPAIVHWYHGHVLTGYFTPVVTAAYRNAERALAHASDRLVCVSKATRDELVSLGIAPRERFEVIRLGLDFDRFTELDPSRVHRVRSELGAGENGTVLAGFVGRLVPIKRVDLLLDAVADARRRVPALRVVIVGDGLLREELEDHARRVGVDDIVRFVGFRHDMEAVVAALDVGVLVSDNEGTPVSLIEAAAGRRCVIATRVGGVPEVVTPESGRLVPPGDVGAIANALCELATDPDLRLQLGSAGRRHVLTGWTVPRLQADVERLYRSVLEERRALS